ncbi:Putative replication protein [Moritella viscosa]|uniref:hypothetical protein n=1 Tax=Moritella viscosa TaxID=80854 RepID=UPI0009213C88|nr:hypothetical protein [Moritella viscosa]SGZ07448.1 Putative replication protein [Moritella viscosa]
MSDLSEAKTTLSREEPAAKSLLDFFIAEIGDTNSICISMKTMEKIFKCHRRTLRRRINILVEKKFISVLVVGSANVYVVNTGVTFRQEKNDLLSAKLKVTMYLNFEEQTRSFKESYTGKKNLN